MHFPTDQASIELLISKIDPIAYAKTRNFTNGRVTRLSPYFSRGVLHAKDVVQHLQSKNYSFQEVETLVKELAWREYYQRVWNHLGDAIHQDILFKQDNVRSQKLPLALEKGQTGIKSIDLGIENLFETGYMHNHVRMYLASICCNIGGYHWENPAKWLYYHLFDADWASNALSWQWVAGTFSQKKYFANQENINYYTQSKDQNTYLDCSYEELPLLNVPEQLLSSTDFSHETLLPKHTEPLQIEKPNVYLFNFYNLDYRWMPAGETGILLLEPSFFKKYPVSQKVLNFVFALSKNIPNIQCFVGEFAELQSKFPQTTFHFKQHPTNTHFKGTEHSRDWLFPSVNEYFTSFSKYWRKCSPLAEAFFSTK